MNIAELVEKVNGKTVVDKPGAEVRAAYAGDLLSDVMGHCGEDSVLITIQNHLNTIAVCTLCGAEIIVICHDRPVPDDMAAAAERENVAIVTTALSQFEVSVALASLPPSAK
ncbi:MAG: hypothetical protein J6T01_01200 [Kiritimatiellae bacterium]|nr:hypothetical protein [Kiritimatiellia bacterium]